MKSSATTIKEISSLSGYSVSTVSKALNNKEDISLKTRELIKNIAKQFNYVPNNYAVALRAKKANAVAVVLPEVTKKRYSQALCYLQKTAEDYGYKVLLYQTFNSKVKEGYYLNSLNDGSIDGVFLISDKSKERKGSEDEKVPIIQLPVSQLNTDNEIKELSSSSFDMFLNLNY
ncbi:MULTISPECIES: LacI family DNA-binding transcriptional regulator [Flavobacteriaceae]|uniref:HTH lacI-type domain-containing protein n=1 Tax=Gaetbulibacter jejuensis TaxID=584607 RepID=A0ABN1JGV0_9FLAO|nr:LacI family DNA-binding transcriptional regulator [Meridianimaribacter sp. CL38]TBV27844.1 LacI family transcriptional regulator [Meridianimaribacter sp. CL38]